MLPASGVNRPCQIPSGRRHRWTTPLWVSLPDWNRNRDNTGLLVLPFSPPIVATSGTVAVFLFVGRQLFPLKLRYQFAADAKRVVIAVNIPFGILTFLAYLTTPGYLFRRRRLVALCDCLSAREYLDSSLASLTHPTIVQVTQQCHACTRQEAPDHTHASGTS